MIVRKGEYKWVPVDQPYNGDITDALLFSIISNLVDQINDLGEEVAQLKNEVEQ